MAKIKKRSLGKTKIKSFPIGFGGIPIQRLSKKEAVKVIRTAVNLGINFFDTARAYSDSEEKIGEAIEDIDKKIYLSSKTKATNKKEALNDVDISLKKLNVEKIDLYHLHNISDDKKYKRAVLDKDSALSGLKEAQKQGKIEYIGITGHSIELLKEALESGEFSVTMFCYNFIENECENKFIEFCENNNVGMLAMKPFAGGRLNNASINLKYILQQPNIIPIPGMEKVAEVNENVYIAKNSYKFKEKEKELIKEFKESLGSKFCRRCGYCQPCSEGVNISVVLRSESFINRMPQSQLNNKIHWSYKALKSAHQCINCGKCIEKCPYNLPIPELIEENIKIIKKYYEKDSV